MGKGTEVVAAAALYGTAWALGVGAVLGIVDAGNRSTIEQDIAANETRVSELEPEVVASDARLHELTVRLGEGCVASLRPYLLGQTLQHVPETDVVGDLIGNPGQPCGDSPTEVRESLLTFRQSNENVTQKQADLENTIASIESQKKDRQSDADFNGLLAGVLLGVAVGAIHGGTAPFRYDSVWEAVMDGSDA